MENRVQRGGNGNGGKIGESPGYRTEQNIITFFRKRICIKYKEDPESERKTQ